MMCDSTDFISKFNTDSDDADLRKNVRRLRIQERHENAKRIQDGMSEAPEEKSELLQTVDESDDKLFQIFVDGKELVTNICVAGDSREIERRKDEQSARDARLQKLEDDASVALEKLKAISNTWDNIIGSNDPLDLNQELKDQKARCLDLIEQKNSLIKEFKEELRMADERFMNDRDAMFDDVSMLAKRIDEQVLVMKKSVLEELENIESAVDNARSTLLAKYQEEWESLFEKRESDEVENMKKKFDLMSKTHEEVSQVFIKHDEKFRGTKIRLETEVQVLEQELEQVKAMCLINSEKLDYNYQVLKKREDENVIIKSQQKRTLNKLQEELMVLRKKIEKKQSAAEQELSRLNKELSAYHRNVIDIEKKADHFSKNNDSKFQQIWDMKTEEAKKLLNKILAADKIIHEQILGLDWIEPELKPLEKDDLPSYKAAVALVSEVHGEAEHQRKLHHSRMGEDKKEALLSEILSLIADNADFLIEEKLEELLKPYCEAEKTLVRLDNVFCAIGVQSAEDIKLLLVYFLPYAKCEICSQENIESERGSVESSSLDVEGTAKSTASFESSQSDFTCERDHYLHIEKIYVLKALKEYVVKLNANNLRSRQNVQVRLAKHRCTVSRLLSQEDLVRYWSRFKEIFPTDEEAVWNALFDGLTKYHNVLQERHKLNMKSQKLKKQNAELRRLVTRYVPDENLRIPQLPRQASPVNSRDLMDIISQASQ